MDSDKCGPLLTQREIEFLVNEKLRAWNVREAWPQRIEWLITSCMDANVRCIPNLLSAGAEALVARSRRNGNGKKFVVFVDQRIYDGSLAHLHMALAEEAAHLILDQPAIASVQTAAESCLALVVASSKKDLEAKWWWV